MTDGYEPESKVMPENNGGLGRGFWVAISAILIAFFGNVTTIAMMVLKSRIDAAERQEAREASLAIAKIAEENKRLAEDANAGISEVGKQTRDLMVELFEKLEGQKRSPRGLLEDQGVLKKQPK